MYICDWDNPLKSFKTLICFIVVFVVAASVSINVTASLGGEQEKSTVVDYYNVMIPMRDGVKLATDIYRPDKTGTYPVLLMRGPYGQSAQLVETGQRWAKRGYVFIYQDVRGRYDSEGTFYPYMFEANDGYDTQQWAGQQPWSTGDVGTLGGSYRGTTQWFSAPLRSSALKAMIPSISPLNYYSDVAYTGGAFRLAERISWGLGVGGRTSQAMHTDWAKTVWHLPLRTMDNALGVNLPHWQDWIAHPSYDDYWAVLNVKAKLSDVDAPAYNIGGWYDRFLKGTLSAYQGARQQIRSEHSREGQKLLIGPWAHNVIPPASSVLGELDFGPDSILDLEPSYVAWFDYWLKGRSSAFITGAPILLFVMGENHWRTENEWPLARTHYTPYYFRSGGRASAVEGEGRGELSLAIPSLDNPNDQYTYNPANPVPTCPTMPCGASGLAALTGSGPRDQTVIEQREDVLSFTSEPLVSDTEITGPVEVILYAASTALDTDFTAKLVDVHPNGKAYNLVDGIIRARYRDSFEKPELLEPNKVYQYTIDLWATSNLFKKGHRIRVDISSSNFPRFDRNPNTGHPFGQNTDLQSATQTIYHNSEYPSHILLPVIPR